MHAGRAPARPGRPQLDVDATRRRRPPPGSAGGTGSRRAARADRAGRPPGPTGAIRKAGSPITGKAAASARVYGCAGAAKTSWLGPSSTIRPAYMTAIRWHTAASVDRSCVMKTTASPRRCWRSSSRRSTCACTITSSAVVGSSAISSRGSQASASADEHALALAAGELVGVVAARGAPAGRRARAARRRAPTRRRRARSASAARIASPIWRPTRCTGLSVCSAPWKTIASSVQRTARRRPGFIVSTSSPSSRTEPVTCAPRGSRRSSAPASDDLPQPDSPARPSVSPTPRSRSTPRTAGIGARARAVGDVQVADREQRRRLAGSATALTTAGPAAAGRGPLRAPARTA